jgi:hypothetical protein
VTFTVNTAIVSFDVHPDGKRLIVNPRDDSEQDKSSNVHATFVLNWHNFSLE